MDINPEEVVRLEKRQQIGPEPAKQAASNQVSGSNVTAQIPFGIENPYFGQFENGPYRLGHLLRNYDVPRVLCDPESVQVAEAIRSHAENGATTLMHGLAVIGSMMMRAGATGKEEGDLEQTDVVSLGELIQHLAVELRFLNELSGSMEDSLRERDLRIAKGGV